MIGKLKPIDRLFFIGCISNADDEGRLLGDPAYLRSSIFPYDSMTPRQVEAMRDRVVSVCRNLVAYKTNGISYLAFTKWARYQKPRYPKPSKLPPPHCENNEVAATTEPLKPCSDLDESLQPNRNQEDEGLRHRVGLGRDGMGWETTSEFSGPEISAAEEVPSDVTMVERDTLAVLKSIPNWPFKYQDDLEHLRELAVDFPGVNLLDEVKNMRAWLRDHPLKPRGNSRLRLRNWCDRAAKGYGVKAAASSGGQYKPLKVHE